MAKFIKTSDNKIYRFRTNHDDYILCTPWMEGEDRRKTFGELSEPKEINNHKAQYEINEMWRNTTFKWAFNGKKYETRGQVYDEKVITPKRVKYNWCKGYLEYNHVEYTNLFKICPEHKWHHVSDWTSKDGIRHHSEYDEKYYLCMYQGKLVWVTVSQYIPQVFFYRFEDIDLEPRIMGGWTNINCLKPVFCVTDKKFI